MARCLLTACRVIDAPVSASRAQSSFKVWPLCAWSRSSSSLRLASASALNTSSMGTICNRLVACQARMCRPAECRRDGNKPAFLFFRRLDDGIVALDVKAQQVPRLLHVRRQRRGGIDCAATWMRHHDAAGEQMQAVLHAARKLPVFLGEIFRVANDGM